MNMKGYISIGMLMIVPWLAAVVGWVLNIYKLATFDGGLDDVTVVEILQFVGIIVAPLGVVMGYIV